MEDWKVRLLVEQKELKEKFVKLVEFINSEEYYKLSDNTRLLLKNQKIAMELYLNVLNMRVFEDVDNITVPDRDASGDGKRVLPYLECFFKQHKVSGRAVEKG